LTEQDVSIATALARYLLVLIRAIRGQRSGLSGDQGDHGDQGPVFSFHLAVFSSWCKLTVNEPRAGLFCPESLWVGDEPVVAVVRPVGRLREDTVSFNRGHHAGDQFAAGAIRGSA
jgi:hypothetical protein